MGEVGFEKSCNFKGNGLSLQGLVDGHCEEFVLIRLNLYAVNLLKK